MAWTPFTRLDHDRSGQRYTSDMTDREFALIAPHLPAQPSRGRKRRTELRAVVDGIFYLLQNGCPWANLPKDFPPKSTVYWYFRRFREEGAYSGVIRHPVPIVSGTPIQIYPAPDSGASGTSRRTASISVNITRLLSKCSSPSV